MKEGKTMKKMITVIIIVAVIILGLAFALGYYFTNYNRIGTEDYYVAIEKKGKPVTEKASDGETFTDYEYTLIGYDENGKTKQLKFTAQKNLRIGAYLHIYYKKDKGVTSYEEVTKKELPKKAASQLN